MLYVQIRRNHRRSFPNITDQVIIESMIFEMGNTITLLNQDPDDGTARRVAYRVAIAMHKGRDTTGNVRAMRMAEKAFEQASGFFQAVRLARAFRRGMHTLYHNPDKGNKLNVQISLRVADRSRLDNALDNRLWELAMIRADEEQLRGSGPLYEGYAAAWFKVYGGYTAAWVKENLGVDAE
jgi:hypothetical protein